MRCRTILNGEWYCSLHLFHRGEHYYPWYEKAKAYGLLYDEVFKRAEC